MSQQGNNVVERYGSTLPKPVKQMLAKFIDEPQDPRDWTVGEWKRALFSPWALANVNNPRSPIPRLPMEIFREIILIIYDQDHFKLLGRYSKPKPKSWRSLMLVCKSWRVVIGTEPAIWRNIHITFNPNWLFLSLARSGGATLNITLNHNPIFCAVTPRLRDLRPMIRKLVLATPRDFQGCGTLAELLGKHMEALEELDIRYLNPIVRPVKKQANMGGGQDETDKEVVLTARLNGSLLPRLRSVKLRDALITGLDFARGAKLTDLVLDLCHVAHPAVLLNVLRSLGGYQSLRRLRIMRPQWPKGGLSHSAPSPVTTIARHGVILPESLRVIDLYDEPCVLRDSILPYVHFHEDIKATIQTYTFICSPDEPLLTFRSILPQLDNAVTTMPALRAAQSVELRVPISPVTDSVIIELIVKSPGHPRFKIAMNNVMGGKNGVTESFDLSPTFSTLMAETVTLLHDAPVNFLTLGGRFRDVFPRDAFLNMLRAFPHLTHLALDGWARHDLTPFGTDHLRNESEYCGVIGMLEALTDLERKGYAAQDPSGSPGVPLPGENLDSLTLDVPSLDHRFMDPLENYVRMRKDGGRPLKRLHLRFSRQLVRAGAEEGSDPGYISSLEGIMDPDGVLSTEMVALDWYRTLDEWHENWSLE